jgi:hypothetical protein
MRKRLEEASRFLSFVLRHEPESIGVELDSEGWAGLDALIAGANGVGRALDRELIRAAVEASTRSGSHFLTMAREFAPCKAIRYALLHCFTRSSSPQSAFTTVLQLAFSNRSWRKAYVPACAITCTCRKMSTPRQKLVSGTDNLLFFISTPWRWIRRAFSSSKRKMEFG